MGLPRSGTTWLGKILDSHPDTFYSHEPDSAVPFRGIPLMVEADSASEYESALRGEVERMQSVRTVRVVGKLPIFPKRHSARLPVWLRAQELLVWKGLARVFGEPNVPRHVAGGPSRDARWVWKSIESTGRLGAIARLFPSARIVFVIRHPCGVAASILRGEEDMKFSAGPSSEDRGFFELLARTGVARSRGLTVERFFAMSAIERIAWRWALLNEKTLHELSGLPNCRVVRYEDLCDRPIEVSRDLLAFAHLDWADQTHAFVSSSTAREDGSYYGVFKDPREAANKWRKTLPQEAIETILHVAGQTDSGRLFVDSESSESSTKKP